MFVEEVIVTTKQGDTVVFPCRCWLGKDDSNGTIVRELIPGKPVPEEVEGKSMEEVLEYDFNKSRFRDTKTWTIFAFQ